ncbi:phage tail tape measure protein [Pseudactinotalea suaedae]|uniref:phage tail tape measure protein n=1 Tax=Pseudactinotalea suaedae TaxID=1524924 RepID=UPI0012E26BC5|nr:phage tail tape measure protein [Pseudactinotalea suaedae]
MATTGAQRDVRIRLESSWEGAGFDLATRAVTKYETDYRRMAQMQMRAEAEMAEAAKKRAAEIEAANKRQMLAMEGAGRVILGLAGATAAGLVLATAAAIDWESAWAGVRKTTDGSSEQMSALEGELRQLARTLPSTHTEIAAVAEAAGQLGVKREDVAEFTRVMIDLGETTDLSADQAATSIAQLMNIMGTAGDDVDELGATIVALGNAGASTESQILLMAQRIAGAGKLVGATEGEVLATASALASMGVSAELGGGVVSRVLQDIYSAVQSGGEEVEGFARIAGMSAQEFSDAWREDPIRALASFADGLNGVEASGGNVITTLTDLGIKSSEEQRILLQLMANTDLLTDSLDLQAQAWNENTALIDEANQRYATTEARLQVARNQITDAAIDIGGTFLPAVADATKVVGQFAAGFSALDAPGQRFVTILGAGVTGLGLLTGGALMAVPKLKELTATVSALRAGSSLLGRSVGNVANLLMGPWGAALAAAGVALAIYTQRQGEAKQRTDALRASLDEMGKITDDTARTLNEAFATTKVDWLTDDIRLMGTSIREIMDEVGVSAEDARGYIEGNADAVARVNAQMDAYREQGGTFTMHLAQANALNDFLDEHSDALVEATDQQEYLAEATGGTAQSQEEAAAATAAATAETEALTAANEELLASYAEADGAFIDLLGGYQSVIDKNTEVAQATADSTESSEDSWQDYYDGFSVSLADYLAELDAMVAAQQAWEANMLLLSGRVSQGVLDHLATLGPEGAPLVAALVDASDDELARLEAVYGQQADNATAAFAENLAAAGPILGQIGAQLGAEAAAEAASAVASGEKTIQDVINEYSLQGVTFDVDADTGPADAALQDFINRRRHLTIQARVNADPNYSPATSQNMIYRAGGGPITGPGTSTSDSIPLMASNNEHMWSAAETAAAGGHAAVAALRASALAGTLRSMPTGAGTVSAPSTSAGGAPGHGSGASYQFDLQVDAAPGYAMEVARLFATEIKTSLGDAMAAAGVSGAEVL